MIKIRCVYEHNGENTILYANNFIDAYTRGASLHMAMEKMHQEVNAYLDWCGKSMDGAVCRIERRFMVKYQGLHRKCMYIRKM